MSDKLVYDLAGGSISLYVLDQIDNNLTPQQRAAMKEIELALFDTMSFSTSTEKFAAEKIFKMGYLAAHTTNVYTINGIVK